MRDHHVICGKETILPEGGDGEAILLRVRDTLIELAHRRRSLILQSAQHGLIPAASSEELKELQALGAAADCFQYVIMCVQELRTRKGTLTVRDLPEWVIKFTGQARAAMTNDQP
jgi:hypothetical protein